MSTVERRRNPASVRARRCRDGRDTYAVAHADPVCGAVGAIHRTPAVWPPVGAVRQGQARLLGYDNSAFHTIVRIGSTTGVCVWSSPVHATCTFGTGTGRLTQFDLVVDVTVTGDPNSATSVWHWDGTYWFGNGD